MRSRNWFILNNPRTMIIIIKPRKTVQYNNLTRVFLPNFPIYILILEKTLTSISVPLMGMNQIERVQRKRNLIGFFCKNEALMISTLYA